MTHRGRRDALIAFLFTLAGILAVSGIALLLPEPPELSPREAALEDPAGAQAAEAFASEDLPAHIFPGFTAPLCGKITSAYGYRTDPFSLRPAFHRGVDIGAAEGTDVLACAAGTVSASAFNTVGGNYILIDHGNGEQSYYGHLQTRLVSKGDTVAHGQVIGLSGATGMVTGPHLHFQLIYRNQTVDPLNYVTIPDENLY